MFDLWQRHLGSTLSWLDQRPTQRSEVRARIRVRELGILVQLTPTPTPAHTPTPTPTYSQVLEAIVRLLSGEPTAPVGGRRWVVLPQLGCGGRYVPEAEAAEHHEGSPSAASPPSPALVASTDGGFGEWLRRLGLG